MSSQRLSSTEEAGKPRRSFAADQLSSELDDVRQIQVIPFHKAVAHALDARAEPAPDTTFQPRRSGLAEVSRRTQLLVALRSQLGRVPEVPRYRVWALEDVSVTMCDARGRAVAAGAVVPVPHFLQFSNAAVYKVEVAATGFSRIRKCVVEHENRPYGCME